MAFRRRRRFRSRARRPVRRWRTRGLRIGNRM